LVSVSVAALGLCACGSSNNPAADGGGGGGGGGAGGSGSDADDCSATGTITLSGAFTGTRSDAPAPGANWSNTNDTGVVQDSIQFGTPFLAGWDFIFPGKPMVTTYTEATTGLSCTITASDPATPTSTWMAVNGVSGTTSQGTCSLTLTAVTPSLVTSNQTQYCVHGTVAATLPAKSGSTATGTVTFAASF
jgi:hypothetical protein